ncbi:MAG: hypothetical protein H6708_30195 [Kofleriaceae bacterium]|nr:hypothetical protein [Myxococcales bacterium]MCB9564678.1 hypothetical protein [Kofleriaceae bacterium]
MKPLFTVAILLPLAVTTACKKDDARAGAAEAKAAEPAAPPAKLTWARLGGLGLEAQVPDGTTVDDNTAGAGFPAATLWTSPTTFVMGAGELSPLQPDLAAAKGEIQKDPNPFKRFTKEEPTEGGWRLEYELESMIDQTPLYGVQIRTTIDGQPWECGSNTSSPAERAQVISICASLRKAS